MSNWRDELQEGAKSPGQRHQENKDNAKNTTQDFHVTQVFPAFRELSEELEAQDKSVKVHEKVPGASIVVRAKSNPHLDQFTYVIVVVEGGRVHANYHYFVGNETSGMANQSNIKRGANVNNTTKDDIARDFVKVFNTVRHDLA
jgi:hypothetical protein